MHYKLPPFLYNYLLNALGFRIFIALLIFPEWDKIEENKYKGTNKTLKPYILNCSIFNKKNKYKGNNNPLKPYTLNCSLFNNKLRFTMTIFCFCYLQHSRKDIF